MRILVVTPLYPPDIAGSAPYVKEFAQRLHTSHAVTVLTYGHIPEAIAGVRIVAVEKRDPLLKRLWRLTKALLVEMRDADVIIAENGPSIELPLFLARLIRKGRVFLHQYDERAFAHALASPLHRLLLWLASTRSEAMLVHSPEGKRWLPLRNMSVVLLSRPLHKPEILPFEDPVTDEWNKYESSWVTHMKEMEEIIRAL